MHAWKKNHQTEMPRNLLFFSLETDSYECNTPYYSANAVLKVGVADYVNWRSRNSEPTQTKAFTNSKEWWDFVYECTRRKETLEIYTHDTIRHLCLLDFGNEIESGRLELCKVKPNGHKAPGHGQAMAAYKGKFTNNRGSVIIECLYRGRRINVRDTYNYFRSSIYDIAKSIGETYDGPLQEPCDCSTALAHCQRTVAIARKAITGLMLEWEANGCGNWQPTIASLAYSSFRHMHMAVAPVPHADDDLSQFESKAYRDGRTQLFWRGDIRNPVSGGTTFGGYHSRDNRPWIDGPVYVVDVDSLYPSVMLDNVYPRKILCSREGKPNLITGITPEELSQCLDQYLCIATLTLTTTEDFYPYAQRDRTIYPVGRFNCTLATPEIKTALKLGHVTNVVCAALYEPAPLFPNFVQYWHSRKLYWQEHGNLLRREMCKTIMNSLAGKFGQHRNYWENIPGRYHDEQWQQWPEWHGPTNSVRHYRTIGKQVQRMVRDGWASTAFVAVAAHINSYARVRMHIYRDTAGRENVYYQGNDSFITNERGYWNLNQAGFTREGSLGLFKQPIIYTEAKLYGPRDYATDGVVTKSGLPDSRQQITDRHWRVKILEDSDSLLLRRPNGVVRERVSEVKGGNPTDFLRFGDDGWYKPPSLWE